MDQQECWVPDCTHSGSYLLMLRSNTCTFPSMVTAANTVEQYGDQAISPTMLFRSKVNMGSLCVCVCVCVYVVCVMCVCVSHAKAIEAMFIIVTLLGVANFLL